MIYCEDKVTYSYLPKKILDDVESILLSFKLSSARSSLAFLILSFQPNDVQNQSKFPHGELSSSGMAIHLKQGQSSGTCHAGIISNGTEDLHCLRYGIIKRMASWLEWLLWGSPSSMKRLFSLVL